MLEKKLNNLLLNEFEHSYSNIKKGDVVQIQLQISTTRKQTFTGVCVKNRKKGLASAVTIQYKLSGQTIIHTFPISTKKIISITKL